MRAVLAVSLCLPLLLTGCAMTSELAAPLPQPGPSLQGRVHGGQQPVAGASVYLFAANTIGYGGNGIAASSANASLSLLNSSVLTNSPGYSGKDDNGNYYVVTDANGNFSIGNDYSCTPPSGNTPGQPVYLYAVGGNPGYGGTNSAAGFLAVLGDCPAAGNFSTVPETSFLLVNEVTTVAAAYAFAGFATDATHVSSSGTPLALTGIANAFNNAADLATVSTGVAPTTIPSGNANAPQTSVNTIANILAACVNSTGPTSTTSTGCSTLFTNAMSAGSSGTTATDTATAAINIAHNPGANVQALYANATGTPVFSPTVATQPADFTLAINFPYNAATLSGLTGIAVDGSGNAWLTSYANSSIIEISSAGTYPAGAGGYSGNGLTKPNGIAIDQSGNIWTYGSTSPNPVVIVEISNTGSFLSGTSGYSSSYMVNSNSIAIDSSGNAWIGGLSGSLFKIAPGGTFLSGVTGYTTYVAITGIAIDGAGSVWLTSGSSSSSYVTKVSSTGSFIVRSTFSVGPASSITIDSGGNAWIAQASDAILKFANTPSGFPNPYVNLSFEPFWQALDGAGNLWVPVNAKGAVVELSDSGTLISSSTGYTGSGLANGLVAVDGSGDVWLAGGGVSEIIGAAVPVITPIAAGLPSTPTSNGSSNLATRP